MNLELRNIWGDCKKMSMHCTNGCVGMQFRVLVPLGLMCYIEDADQAACGQVLKFGICLGLQVVISEISEAMQPVTTKKVSCASFAEALFPTSSSGLDHLHLTKMATVAYLPKQCVLLASCGFLFRCRVIHLGCFWSFVLKCVVPPTGAGIVAVLVLDRMLPSAYEARNNGGSER